MNINFIALLLAAFSSLVVGFIWYNPKVFGTIWMREAGIQFDDAKKPNMGLILFGAFIYAFFIAFIIQFLVIHQYGVLGVVGGNPNNEAYKVFMTQENQNAFRTLKHGALHGTGQAPLPPQRVGCSPQRLQPRTASRRQPRRGAAVCTNGTGNTGIQI